MNVWLELKSANGFASNSTQRSKFGVGSPSKSGQANVLAGVTTAALPEIAGATGAMSAA